MLKTGSLALGKENFKQQNMEKEVLIKDIDQLEMEEEEEQTLETLDDCLLTPYAR